MDSDFRSSRLLLPKVSSTALSFQVRFCVTAVVWCAHLQAVDTNSVCIAVTPVCAREYKIENKNLVTYLFCVEQGRRLSDDIFGLL